MALNDWQDGPEGGTPLSAARLNERDAAIIAAQETADEAAPAEHTHAAGDVSSGTLAAARIPDLAISKVTGLQDALDGKQTSGSYAAASHPHTIANVTGLQDALDAITGRLDELESE